METKPSLLTTPPFSSLILVFENRDGRFFSLEGTLFSTFLLFSPFQTMLLAFPLNYNSIEWYFTSESFFFSQIWFLDEYEKSLGRTDRRTDIVEWKVLLFSEKTERGEIFSRLL